MAQKENIPLKENVAVYVRCMSHEVADRVEEIAQLPALKENCWYTWCHHWGDCYMDRDIVDAQDESSLKIVYGATGNCWLMIWGNCVVRKPSFDSFNQLSHHLLKLFCGYVLTGVENIATCVRRGEHQHWYFSSCILIEPLIELIIVPFPRLFMLVLYWYLLLSELTLRGVESIIDAAIEVEETLCENCVKVIEF